MTEQQQQKDVYQPRPKEIWRDMKDFNQYAIILHLKTKEGKITDVRSKKVEEGSIFSIIHWESLRNFLQKYEPLRDDNNVVVIEKG